MLFCCLQCHMQYKFDDIMQNLLKGQTSYHRKVQFSDNSRMVNELGR